MLLEKGKTWVQEQIDDAIHALAEVFKQKIQEMSQRIKNLESEIAFLKQSPSSSSSAISTIPQQLPEKLPPGVSRHRNKYRARRNGKYLGVFNTVEEAVAAYEASGNNGTIADTVGTTGNIHGNVGAAGPLGTADGTPGASGHEEGPNGNAEGTAGTTGHEDDTRRTRGPRVYPVSSKSPCRHLFYYHVTEDGLELLTRYNNREELLGFFDTPEEISQAIIDYLAEHGADLDVLETLFETTEC